MEAKDTVMSDRELEEAYLGCGYGTNNWYGFIKVMQAISKAQAEISFKVGYQGCAEKMSYILPAKFKKARKAGMRKVVEFINSERINQNPSVWYSRWQAKIKEWGL